MNNPILLTTGKFAKLCNTTKETLYYYKEMDLLKPVSISEKGYFMYSVEQFFEFDMIRLLRDSDCTVPEIKEYLNNYGTDQLIRILQQKKGELYKKIQNLQAMINNISITIDSAEKALSSTYGVPSVIKLEEATFIVTQLSSFPPQSFRTVTKCLNEHFSYCNRHSIPKTYPMSSILSHEALLKGDFTETHFATQVKHKNNYNKTRIMSFSTGRYAVIYHKGGYDTIDKDFELLINYIKSNGLKITGPGYTVDLANNLSSKQFENFVIQISIPVG